MQAVITVVGKDKVGIIAAVTATIARHGVNVLSINQTIVNDIFNMIMICEVPEEKNTLIKVQDDLAKTAEQLDVQIQAQHMDIFKSMHQID